MMKMQFLPFLVLAFLLSACQTETAELRSVLRIKQEVVLDKASLDRTRADVVAHGFTEPEVSNLLDDSLTKAVQQPGQHPYIPLIAANGNNLYVGATSTRAPHHAVETELVVKERSRGILHIYATWEESDGVWTPQADTYKVVAEPPATGKKQDAKKAK